MKRHHLVYPLTDGFVDDWLILGPCDRATDSRPEPGEAELAFRDHVLAGFDHTQADFSAPTELNRFACGEATLFWNVEHCEPDHLLDWSGRCPTYTHRRAWAFAVLASTGPQAVSLCVTTTCPTAIWLNGKPVGYCEHLTDLADQTPRSYRFLVTLKPRDNSLLVRLDQVVRGDAALAVAVRVEGISEKSVKVKVPTVTENVKERLAMERALQCVHLDRAVYTRGDTLRLISPEDTPGQFQTTMRVQTPDGWIYGESYGSVGAGTTIESVDAVQLPSQAMEAFLMPSPTLYYESQMRAQRALPFWVANRPFAQAPEQAGDSRLIDALREATKGNDIYAEYAQMAAGWWNTVSPKNIQATIARIARDESDCLADLLALIGMRLRMGGHERFPAELLPELDAAIIGFDYAAIAGEAVAGESGRTPLQEFEQILLCASRILAGQLFPRSKFAASGLTGRQERNRGEKLALAWLHERARTGFSLWNSHSDEIVMALSHLADLAKNEQVAELAAVLLDKVLFGIAVHSFRGTFGGSRGSAEPAFMRSGRLAPEAGIGRLIWGMGGYQDGLRAVLSLALAGESYSLPAVISSIANDFETEVWARERHQIVTRGAPSSGSPSEVHLATYRTADFMLSAAQDYQPGRRGGKEHIWQATMGPEALVFTNHPASFSQSDSREAGWWHGNGSLPRVVQWKDALVALYNLPEDAWLRFTHAYFPSYAFDELVLEEGWAFARAGDAYIALYASQGLELMRRGPDAHRELRSPGLRNVWLCQMGSRDTDSSFENFRIRVVASKPAIEGLHVAWGTIRGDRLEFDWSSALLLNGQVQPITGSMHHESIYATAEFPAETMDITYKQDIVRLHFA